MSKYIQFLRNIPPSRVGDVAEVVGINDREVTYVTNYGFRSLLLRHSGEAYEFVDQLVSEEDMNKRLEEVMAYIDTV